LPTLNTLAKHFFSGKHKLINGLRRDHPHFASLGTVKEPVRAAGSLSGIGSIFFYFSLLRV
jgi:hypothetical protein